MDTSYTSLASNEREIRLLELAPGNYDDDLVITLRVSSLKRKLPQYHALSYAWGQELSPRLALVNRNSMPIGLNLDGALRHLRCGLTEPAMMWVDAICINQQDVEERSSQVLLMKEIYSSAEHVQIYLGPEQRFDAWVAALIRNDEVPCTENEIHALLTHVESICGRPWFGRVWVAQELALSHRDPSAHIGTIALPWSQFYEYIVGLERRKPAFLDGHPRVTAFMQSMERMRRLGRVRVVPTTSINLQVFRSAPALATDARDKVFGLLGICAFSPGQWEITPDYTKSVTRVFTEATVSMLQEPQNIPYGLMPLQPPIRAAGRLWYQRLPDLPSWVLDLNLSCHVNDQYCEMGPYWMIPERAVHPGKFLPKTSHIPDRVRIDQDFKHLRVPGLHLGTIVATYSSLVNLDSYMGFQNRTTALRHVYRTYMKPRLIPAQTLLHALTVDRKTPVRDPQLSARFLETFEELLESDIEITFPSPFFDILVALSGHEECQLFFTDTDQVGIAYHYDLDHGIRVGDEVVGLFGVNFPFVLRRFEHRRVGGAVYNMVNLAHIADHEWEHGFLEDAGMDAQWSDYERYGLKEYTIT